MKFKCNSCFNEFVYAGELTFDATEMMKGLLPEPMISIRVCPHCGKLDFDEIQSEQQKKIVDRRKTGDDQEIRDLLKDGWIIIQEWSKETLLYLYEKPEVKGA